MGILEREMSDEWEHLGAAENVIAHTLLPPFKERVRNKRTGEERLVWRHAGQTVGEAIANGQWADMDEDENQDDGFDLSRYLGTHASAQDNIAQKPDHNADEPQPVTSTSAEDGSGSWTYIGGSGDAVSGKRGSSKLTTAIGVVITMFIIYHFLVPRRHTDQQASLSALQARPLENGWYRQQSRLIPGPFTPLPGKISDFTLEVNAVEVLADGLRVHFSVQSNVGKNYFDAVRNTAGFKEKLFMVGAGLPAPEFQEVFWAPYLIVDGRQFGLNRGPVLRGKMGGHLYHPYPPFLLAGDRILKINLGPRQKVSGYFSFVRPSATTGTCDLVVPHLNGWQQELVVRGIQLVARS